MTDRKSPAEGPPGRVETDRIGLAAYLLARGLTLVAVEGQGRSITFLFDGENSEAEIQNFYDGAQISAVGFIRAEREIKDRLWDRRRTLEREKREE